jgi:N-acetylneuraminic acid mutarotase
MTTELEDRLRADLPRLAELIERDSAPIGAPASVARRTRRIVVAGIAACIALAALVVGVAVRSGTHEHVSTTTPSVETTPSSWRALPPSPLGSRANAVVAWTGSEVLVWGGYEGDANAPLALQSGAAYHPATNTWRKIADNQWAHPGAIGVWGSDRLYVLAKNSGAYYLPATNQWHDLPRIDAGTYAGFVGTAVSGTTLYGITYSGDSLDRPVLRVFTYAPGFAAWQSGSPMPAALRITGTASGACPSGLHCGVARFFPNPLSVVRMGSELVISDGGREVWSYDPAHDSWRALPSLPEAASATSLGTSNGSLVAVFLNTGGLKAARLGSEGWAVTTSGDVAHAITEPLAVDAGGTLVVIDRAGKNPPIRADEATGGWEQMAGYPLALGTEGNAVWTGKGLFVWGGLKQDTTSLSLEFDAAWYGK